MDKDTIKEIKKLGRKIDYLISNLQVYGYQIRINNDNLANIHNIDIFQFQKIEKGFHKGKYKRENIRFLTFALPEEGEQLLTVFKEMLKSEVDK